MTKIHFRPSKKTAKPREDYFYDKPGSLPGTLSIQPDATPPDIILIDYNQTNATRKQLATPEECLPYLNSCLLYTSPSPRDKRQSRMPSSA